ncbi:MAG TPA: hypothetical protein VMW75_00370 [Thermoanaerobaculia bacterium]|nr:hypothetical protein [Thermoanaerobaculia bacterium]
MRDLPLLPLVLFVATYLALAAGRLPRLALDRTGCALLGAIAMLASGALDLGQAAASVLAGARRRQVMPERRSAGEPDGRQ